MTVDQIKAIRRAKDALSSAKITGTPAVIGFDGFVDEISEAVDKRTSPDTYDRIQTIAELGERITKAAGLSTNIELVPKVIKLGGNGPIMANALAALGLDVTYIGALGRPLHPVFRELALKSRVISIAQPGHTDALEFTDGTIMLGKLESIKNINWENLSEAIPLREMIELFSGTKLIATVNWTMIPFMTEIWRHLIDDVFSAITYEEPPIIFFDLADPEKRSRHEIEEALETIHRFNGPCRATLGLNRKEATQVAEALGLRLSCDPANAPLDEITQAIAERMNIYGLVVHPLDQAACVLDGVFCIADGPYTAHPKLTTGAGDNFNAGFCLGQVLNLYPKDCLILGAATSGFYVRYEYSPSLSELLDFLDLWAGNTGRDFA
ncbi:MAG: hypothetical protein ACOYEP_11585 [Limnochordia bacterium]|jgi:hypothetical protein